MEFEREETPTIMDGLVIRWYGKVPWINKPEISASRNGVCICGAFPTLSTSESIDSMKNQLDEAYRISRTMK